MGNEISYNRENLRQLKCHRCPKSSFDGFKSLKRHVLENHIVEKAEEEAERKELNEMFESDKNENVVSKKRKNGPFNEDTTPPTSVKKPRASMRRQSSESPNDENANNDLSVSKNETPPTGEKKTKPRRNSSLKDSDVSTLQSDSPTVGNRRRLSPRNRSESESPNDLNVVAKSRTARRKQSEESESSSKHDSSLATDKSDTTPKTKPSDIPKNHNKGVISAFSSSAKRLNRLLDDEKSKSSLSKDAIVKKLKDMKDEDFIKYNIGEKYDEMEIYRRARLLTPNDDCVKVDEFKPGKVAWAQWRKIWWPCVIEKYWKSDSRSKNKVVIRYYEHENGLSPIFKLDTIKVELFFRNKNHFNLKTMAPIYEERRYDFFVCYTSALEDFVEDLENEERLMAEKTQKQATAKSGGARSSSENGRKTVDAKPLKSATTDDENTNKRCIEGKWYTIEDIRAIATGPNSKQMDKVINKREEYSQKLIKLIKSQECKV